MYKHISQILDIMFNPKITNQTPISNIDPKIRMAPLPHLTIKISQIPNNPVTRTKQPKTDTAAVKITNNKKQAPRSRIKLHP